LDSPEWRHANLNARPGGVVSKKLEPVSNSKGNSVAVSEQLVRVLDKATQGRVALVVSDSS